VALSCPVLCCAVPCLAALCRALLSYFVLLSSAICDVLCCAVLLSLGRPFHHLPTHLAAALWPRFSHASIVRPRNEQAGWPERALSSLHPSLLPRAGRRPCWRRGSPTSSTLQLLCSATRLPLALACREEALLAAGFTDIFLPIKARENEEALALLPDVCAELDQHAEQVGAGSCMLRGG